MARLRVIIVDDHAVVREGTRKLLEHDPAIEVVGEAGSGAEAVTLAEATRPDVVLLDLALPDRGGIEVARDIRTLVPASKIVVLSAYDDDDYVYAAMEAGVSAYLVKTVRSQEVLEAIHAVEQGQVILHPTVATKLRRSLQRPSAGELEPLSLREMEVLRLAATGCHNKEIAAGLSISLRTVEGHFSHILTKLGVTSRTEAVVYGLARHWFSVQGETDGGRAAEARTEARR